VFEEYAVVKSAVEAAGYFTSFQPIDTPGDRLVCASEGGDWGLGGCSFWVAIRNGRWFIATWTPHIYEIPIADDVSRLVIDVLANNHRRCYEIDRNIRERFGLTEVADDMFD
jgi:hypothetical protein